MKISLKTILLVFCSTLAISAEKKEPTMKERLGTLVRMDRDYTDRAGTALININESAEIQMNVTIKQILKFDLPLFEIEGDKSRFNKIRDKAETIAEFNKLNRTRLVKLYQIGTKIAAHIDTNPAKKSEFYDRIEKETGSSSRSRHQDDLKIRVAGAYIRALLIKKEADSTAFMNAYIAALRKINDSEQERRGAESDELLAEQALVRDLVSGLPGAGEYLDLVRIIYGKDDLTGEDLSGLERMLEGFLLITPEALDLLIKKNRAVREALERFTKKAGNIASDSLLAIARKLKNKTDELKSLAGMSSIIAANKRTARELAELGENAVKQFGKSVDPKDLRLKQLWQQGKKQGKQRIDDLAQTFRRAGTEDELMAAYAALRKDKFALNELQGPGYQDLRRNIKSRIEDSYFTHVNSAGKSVIGKVDDEALDTIGTALRNSANKMDDDALLALRKKARSGDLGLDELEKLRSAEARKKMNQQLKMHNQKHGAIGGGDIDFDEVEFTVFNATNKPPAPDKIGFDRDITYRAVIPEKQIPVKRASGKIEMVTVPATEIDIPASMVEPHYNKSLYQNMNPNAGPIDMLSKEGFDKISEFGSKMDHQVTDYMHGDAYLVDDINNFFRDPTTLTKNRASSFSDTVVFKSEHWLERGEETLHKMGLSWDDIRSGTKNLSPDQAAAAAEAMSEVAEGIRQSSKQYDNYLTKFMTKGGFDPYAALSPELIQGMNVFKMVREGAITIPEAQVALKAMGLSISDIVSKAGLEYEAFKKLKEAGIKFVTPLTGSAFKNMLNSLIKQSIYEVKKKDDDESDKEGDEPGKGGQTYNVTAPAKPTPTTSGVLGLPEPGKLEELEKYYEFCGKKLTELEAEVSKIKTSLLGLKEMIEPRDNAEELIEQLKILHQFLQDFLAKYKFQLSKIEINAKASNETGITIVKTGAVVMHGDRLIFNVDPSIPTNRPEVLMRVRWQLCNSKGLLLPGEMMKHQKAFMANEEVTTQNWEFAVPKKFAKTKYLVRVIQEVIDYPAIKSVAVFNFKVGDPVKLKRLIITPGTDIEKHHDKLDTETSPHLMAYMEFADTLQSLEVEAKAELTADNSILQEDAKTFSRRDSKKEQRLTYSLDKGLTKSGDTIKFTLKLIPHIGLPIEDDKSVTIEEKEWELKVKILNSHNKETKRVMRHDSCTAKIELPEEKSDIEIGEIEWFIVTPGGNKKKSKGTYQGKSGLTKKMVTDERWTSIGEYEVIAVLHSGDNTYEGHAFFNLIEEPEVVITVFNDKGEATSEIKRGKRFDAKAALPSIADDIKIGDVKWGIRAPDSSSYKFSSRSRSGKEGLHLGVKTKDKWKIGMYGLICKVKLGEFTASGETEFELTEPDTIIATMKRPVLTGQWSTLSYPEEDVTIDLSKSFKLEGLGKYKDKKYWKLEGTNVSFRPIKDGRQRVLFDFVDKEGERTHFKTTGKAELTDMPIEIDWDKVVTKNKKNYVSFKMTLPDSFEPKFAILIKPDDGVKLGPAKKKRGRYHFDGKICLDEMDSSRAEIIFDLSDKTDAIAQGVIEIDDCECKHPPSKVKIALKRFSNPTQIQNAMRAIGRIKDEDRQEAEADKLSKSLLKDIYHVYKWMGDLKKCRHIDSGIRKAFKSLAQLLKKHQEFNRDGEISDAEGDILEGMARRAAAGMSNIRPGKIKPGFMGGKSSFLYGGKK